MLTLEGDRRHPETIGGKRRGEVALLRAAVLNERLLGLHKLLPIDPKSETVPPFLTFAHEIYMCYVYL